MRKIIVLRRTRFAPRIEYTVAFWLDTPGGRQSLTSNATATSQVRTITAPELADLRAGIFREEVHTVPMDTNASLAQVQAALESLHSVLQTAWTNSTVFDRYGSSWDGVSWTMQNNP